MNARKVFIDTDIGDDIDDALAIAMALRSPELEVLGISTVYKNVRAREQLTLNLLQEIGRLDVPTAAGVSRPLSGNGAIDMVPHQCRNLNKKIPSNSTYNGVQLLLETLHQHPDVWILPLGPLSNIAVAILLEPEIFRGVNIVLMGGAFCATYPEYNIMCDPEAANIVLNSGANVQMLGLDVTTSCVLTKSQERWVCGFTEGYQGFLSGLSKIWLETSQSKKITLHDPLVIAYLLDPTLVEMVKAPVKVVTEYGQLRGLTINMRHPFRLRAPLPPENVKFAVHVEQERACKQILQRIFETACPV